jgi:hypothetical protein
VRIDVYAIGMMYSPTMKRLQIYIDDEADELLARRSRRDGRSKAALIRDAVHREYGGPAEDPLDVWGGGIDEAPGDIDEVIYRS